MSMSPCMLFEHTVQRELYDGNSEQQVDSLRIKTQLD